MEESGQIVLNLTPDLVSEFKLVKCNAELAEVLYELADICGIDPYYIDNSEAGFDQILTNKSLVFLEYSSAVWSDLSAVIVKQGTDIEYYSQHDNEYGTSKYYSLTNIGERIEVIVDSESNSAAHINESKDGIKLWENSIPAFVKEAFPKFI